MVRLKEVVHLLFVLRLPCFNSKMVRLKAQLLKKSELVISMFQFQNGTIKRIIETITDTVDIMFQFQNGTIKRLENNKWRPDAIMFQFQNGTIKRSEM